MIFTRIAQLVTPVDFHLHNHLIIMSAIDSYKHRCLGFIECPSTNGFITFNEGTRKIAIYELLENIAIDEDCFDGNAGDIILGGGRGEAPAFRISIPLAFQFFGLYKNSSAKLEFNSLSDVFKAFWTPRQSYILCEGFMKLGWTADTEIEIWLAENVCKLLVSKIEDYSIYDTRQLDLKTNLVFDKL